MIRNKLDKPEVIQHINYWWMKSCRCRQTNRKVQFKMKTFLAFFAICALTVAQELDSDGLHFRETDLDSQEYQTGGIEPQELFTSPESDADYWTGKAFAQLQKQLRKKPNTRRAKNVIMFLGDGMSIPTLAATRFYGAELESLRVGEKEFLSFEEFPYIGLSRTYCTDGQVADSACSATAYLGGVKGNTGTIGVTGKVKRGDCTASLDENNRVHSIALAAQRAGKATGVVTNTRITHASPAGTYAHVADRDWESDYYIQKDGRNSTECDDIAKQLILREPGRNFNVIMGGGRKNFIPKIEYDPIERANGYRLDNVNLVNEWKRDKLEKKKRFAYVTTKDELRGLIDTPDYLMGLFAYDHLDDHVEENPLQPTLEEMTEAAIKVLQKNRKGYFLFVEGGRIDMAHHRSKAQISLDETLQFSKAIAKAVEMTNETNTLIVVTSDHAHTMSFSGYAKRSDSVLGFAGTGKDKLPYAVLNYANGPGYNIDSTGRHDLRQDNMKDVKYTFPSGVPLKSETHGGDDVGVFARGPYSHIFSGSYEQNYIPHAMAYAANISLHSQPEEIDWNVF